MSNRVFRVANSLARKLSGDPQARAIKFGQTVKSVCWIVYTSNGKVCSQFLGKDFTEQSKRDDVLVFLSNPEKSPRDCYVNGQFKVYSLMSRSVYLMQSSSGKVVGCTCKGFVYNGVCKHAKAAKILINCYLEDEAKAAKESITPSAPRQKESVNVVKQRLASVAESLSGSQSEILSKRSAKSAAKPAAKVAVMASGGDRNCKPSLSNPADYSLPSKIIAGHRAALAIQARKAAARSQSVDDSVSELAAKASVDPVGSIADVISSDDGGVFGEIVSEDIIEFRFDTQSSLWVSDTASIPSQSKETLSAYIVRELSFGSTIRIVDLKGNRYECYLAGDKLSKRKI